MRAKDLERLLAKRTGKSGAFVDLCGRRLRQAGLIPLGGRGPYAPVINARHAAALLIAASAETTAEDAADTVNAFERLVHAPTSDSFIEAPTFGEALQRSLADDRIAAVITEIRLDASVSGEPEFPPAAVLRWYDSKRLQHETVFTTAFAAPEVSLESKHAENVVRRSAIIGGGLVRTIASLLTGTKNNREG
jgi:hypothetical protein